MFFTLVVGLTYPGMAQFLNVTFLLSQVMKIYLSPSVASQSINYFRVIGFFLTNIALIGLSFYTLKGCYQLYTMPIVEAVPA